jgi:hypothetical protein
MAYVDTHLEGKAFLVALCDAVGGNLSGQTSMYDIGAAVGLDRTAAKQVAEELIGWGLVEVRTLSGAIGITEEGLAEAGKHGAAAGPETLRLGNDPVLSANVLLAVQETVISVKAGITDLGLAFEPLSELMADLRSIDAQLSSPRPKTAVVRALFESILAVLKKARANGLVGPIEQML